MVSLREPSLQLAGGRTARGHRLPAVTESDALAVKRARAELRPTLAKLAAFSLAGVAMPHADRHLISTLSHELATPLTSLSLATELLLTEFDSMGKERVRHLLQRIRQNAFWLEGLVGNLRATSALDAANVAPQREPVRLSACVDAALGLLEPVLERNAQRVHVSGPADELFARGDAELIERVLLNLLTNAAKYSPRGSTITVEVQGEGAWAQVRVADQGPGVPAEERQRIFEPYVRGERAQQSGSAGLGLGLAVVKALVELQGGRVGVESRPGEGACFWFTLPRAPTRPRRHPKHAPRAAASVPCLPAPSSLPRRRAHLA